MKLHTFTVMLMVFTISFTISIMVSMFFIPYNNLYIWIHLGICVLCGLLSPLVSSEALAERGLHFAGQVLYVILLNVIFVAVFILGNINPPPMTYVYSAISSVAVFILVKYLIFRTDKTTADSINRALVKRKKEKAACRDEENDEGKEGQ